MTGPFTHPSPVHSRHAKTVVFEQDMFQTHWNWHVLLPKHIRHVETMTVFCSQHLSRFPFPFWSLNYSVLVSYQLTMTRPCTPSRFVWRSSPARLQPPWASLPWLQSPECHPASACAPTWAGGGTCVRLCAPGGRESKSCCACDTGCGRAGRNKKEGQLNIIFRFPFIVRNRS
jgi:hypothetical protein